jgi:hypothetical protein
MHLLYPEAPDATLDVGTTVTSILNATQSNKDTNPNDVNEEIPQPKKRSWFASLLEHIPGYTWLRIKLGRLIIPTYEMSPEQLEDYFVMMAKQERLAEEKANKEADMKVQKFMAKRYPDYYFKKYVFVHPEGSEERKRALFIFVLTNKQELGVYYTRQKDLYTLRREFDKIGVTMTGNIVADLLTGVDVNITSLTNSGVNGTELGDKSRRIRRRIEQNEGQEIEVIVPEEDLNLYLSAKQMVEGTSIKGLIDPRPQTEREVPQSYRPRPVVWHDEVIARARYN